MAEAERIKPRSLYIEEAVAFALESRWADALSTNRALLDRYGPDEDAFNRVGKALTELGDLNDAMASYGQALELNPLNVIAGKNHRKLQSLIDHAERPQSSGGRLHADLFTEEPGKSGLTVLTPPPGGVGVKVAPGDSVSLKVNGSSLYIETLREVQIGEVDPKIARRLVPLIASGNRYEGAVARVSDDRIEVMIRETHQAPENSRKSSFPVTRGLKGADFRPYAKESLLTDRGADLDLPEEEDTEPSPVTPSSTDDDLDGMQTVEGDFDTASPPDDEDDDDDDVDTRPEDEY